MKEYVAFLTGFNKKRRIEFTALNMQDALDFVKEKYPNLNVSMIWYKWFD